MHLKSLEIQGFKSFPDKTTIQFGSDITAIVGPNGSGKSNISDSILWVMGEQSTKTLRGAKMEDVIFGGTQKRAPVGFAEATLTLDNTDRALPYDTDEVMVTRRYYRSGDSEFYINKQSARLRDIHELFMDTGLGREGYSNVSQGRIDEILAVKSTDRREIFEEAAGISKYRHRKEETERKLLTTEDNLLRIGDKVSELELQLDPLRLQSEKARNYLEYKAELRGLEIAVWLENLDKLAAAAKKAEEDYTSSSFVLEQEHMALEGLYRKAEELSGALREQDAALESVREQVTALEASDRQLDGQVALLQGNIRNNQQNADRIREELSQQEGRSRLQTAGTGLPPLTKSSRSSARLWRKSGGRSSASPPTPRALPSSIWSCAAASRPSRRISPGGRRIWPPWRNLSARPRAGCRISRPIWTPGSSGKPRPRAPWIPARRPCSPVGAGSKP